MSNWLEQLKEVLGEVSDINRAAAVLAWDQETYMPPGGVANRADQLTTLRRIAHVRFTAEEVGGLIDAAEGGTSGLPFDSDEASLVRVTRRDYEHARKLPRTSWRTLQGQRRRHGQSGRRRARTPTLGSSRHPSRRT